MSGGAARARRSGAPDARVASDGARPAPVDAPPSAMTLLWLQRRVGNAAVTGLVNGGPAVVQRGGAGGRGTDRPGAKWPYGPISTRKSMQHTLAEYLGWVKEVEAGYGRDKQAVLQRLRRLYYRATTGGAGGAAGANFDRVIAPQAGAEGEPLDTTRVSAAALDGLYETDGIVLPGGQQVDQTHILAGLDTAVAGVTTEAGAAAAIYDVPWTGIVTWTGDLASWFVEWLHQRKLRDDAAAARPTTEATEAGPVNETPMPGDPHDGQLLLEVGKSKTAKDDLLGDMDAQNLAAGHVRRSTADSVKADGRPVRHANVATELDAPVSAILETYYGRPAAGQPDAPVSHRFADFVRSAAPPIPHETRGSTVVSLAAGAEEAIYQAVRNTVMLLIQHGTKDRSEPWLAHDAQLREIARRYTTFLAAGLAGGDAPWL